MHNSEDKVDWLEAELADTLDEDYELELSEPALSEEIRKIYRTSHPPPMPRVDYFRRAAGAAGRADQSCRTGSPTTGRRSS